MTQLKTDIRPDQIDITELARSFNAWQTTNYAFKQDAENKINELLKLLPSGSGLNSGVQFDWQASKPNKLVFKFGFHHMSGDGYYTSWTQHKLIITPCFVFGFNMQITGRDKNDIKDYLGQVFEQTFWY